MSARPETLEFHSEVYEALSKKFLDPKILAQFAGEIRDEKTRELIAHSVIQVFSLTPKSFAPKFSELCDCLVKSRMATEREAELFKRIGDAYIREDADQAQALLGDLEKLGTSSDFVRRVQEQNAQVQSQSGDGSRRRLWEFIGGLVGAVIGGAIAGWPGVGIGWNVGKELGGLLHDDWHANHAPTSNVRAMPNGDPCTGPIWR